MNHLFKVFSILIPFQCVCFSIGNISLSKTIITFFLLLRNLSAFLWVGIVTFLFSFFGLVNFLKFLISLFIFIFSSNALFSIITPLWICFLKDLVFLTFWKFYVLLSFLPHVLQTKSSLLISCHRSIFCFNVSNSFFFIRFLLFYKRLY